MIIAFGIQLEIVIPGGRQIGRIEVERNGADYADGIGKIVVAHAIPAYCAGTVTAWGAKVYGVEVVEVGAPGQRPIPRGDGAVGCGWQVIKGKALECGDDHIIHSKVRAAASIPRMRCSAGRYEHYLVHTTIVEVYQRRCNRAECVVIVVHQSAVQIAPGFNVEVIVP